MSGGEPCPVCGTWLADIRTSLAKAEAEYNAAYQTVIHLSGRLGEAEGQLASLRARVTGYLAALNDENSRGNYRPWSDDLANIREKAEAALRAEVAK